MYDADEFGKQMGNDVLGVLLMVGSIGFAMQVVRSGRRQKEEE